MCISWRCWRWGGCIIHWQLCRCWFAACWKASVRLWAPFWQAKRSWWHTLGAFQEQRWVGTCKVADDIWCQSEANGWVPEAEQGMLAIHLILDLVLMYLRLRMGQILLFTMSGHYWNESMPFPMDLTGHVHCFESKAMLLMCLVLWRQRM